MREVMVIAVLLICGGGSALTGGLAQGTQDSAKRIGPEAVWGPGMSILQDIKQQCSSSAGPQFGECFVGGMQKSGASPQAVAFTRGIDNTGYLRDFRQVGPVDVAYVYYPFRANENQGAFLVNGVPAMIDIDDQSRLAKSELEKNPVYAALARKFSEITIWPGERNGTDYPVVKRLPRGGLRFVIDYRLRNVCHACELVGSASFAFDFDGAGKFLGTKLIGVKAAGRR